MSSSYFRVKKWRALHQTEQVLNNQNCENNSRVSENNSSVLEPCGSQESYNGSNNSNHSDINISDNDSINIEDVFENINCEDLYSNDASHNSSAQSEKVQEVMPKKTLCEKLRCWTLDNINVLTLSVVTDLLCILREEGHEDLPKTSQRLLKTKHCRPMGSVLSKRETTGTYVYFGIKHVLEKIVDPVIYTENKLSIQVHIDGISIYNNSLIQVWPIVVKVHHDNYDTKPVTVALYCGDSKPSSSNDYLKDFVKEANEYISDGVILNGTKYLFEIFCIVADSPARAFIKNIKNPGGFYACERCIVKGTTKNHKRIYSNINCDLRTKNSFKKKLHAKHHLEDQKSSRLSKLKQFDPVNDIVLDSMHLLYLGVMKNLLEKLLVVKKHSARLGKPKVIILRELMKSVSADIPVEFERKLFDIDQISKWKATQFRFFLLYIGPLAFKNVYLIINIAISYYYT